jgi:hypothetical protein
MDLMKKHLQIEKANTQQLVINIAPENWRVSEPAQVRICQMPAPLHPGMLPYTPKLPRMEVWRLHESWTSFSPLPINDFSNEGTLC